MTITTTPPDQTSPASSTPTRGVSDEDKLDLTKVASWDGDRLVLHESAMKKVIREKLSPSTSKAIGGGCGARWAAERLMPEPFDPFTAANLGSSVHEIFEDFFAEEYWNRSRATALAMLERAKAEMWPGNDQMTLAKRAEWHGKVYHLMDGLWKIEEPMLVKVAALEQGFADHVLVAGVPFVGYVDRTDYTETKDGEKGRAVVDYKGLALDTPIPTPTGWTTMGALEVGDQVLGTHGDPVTVTIKSQIHNRRCYELTFSDGSTVVCDNVHLWAFSVDGADVEVIDADAVAAAYLSGCALALPVTRLDEGLPRTLVAIAPVDSVPTQCIQVDAEDSLYLCGPTMVVTHNTGKMPDRNKIQRFGDVHGDQMRLYNEAYYQETGERPVRATLYYTQFGKKKDAALSAPYMKKTLDAFEASWVKLKGYEEAQAFPTQVGPLCGWCPLVNTCPSAAAAGKTDRTGKAKPAGAFRIPVMRPLRTEIAVSDPYQAAAAHEPYDPYDQTDPAAPDVVTAARVAEAAPEIGAENGADRVHENAAPAHINKGDTSPAENAPARPADESSEDFARTTPTSMGEQMSKIFSDDKPWFDESEGLFNANSYAAGAMFGATTLAYEQMSKNSVPLSRDGLAALARTFQYMVYVVQDELGGSSKFSDGLNTRLRGALYGYIEQNPIPFGADAETWSQWVSKGIKAVRSMALVAHGLFTEAPVDQPWLTLAVTAPQAVAG